MSTEAGAFLNPILPEFLSRLDPQFVDIYNNNQAPRLRADQVSIDEYRSNPSKYTLRIAEGPTPDVGKVTVHDIHVDQPKGTIKVQVYTPTHEAIEAGGLKTSRGLPAHINYHGGGWVIGSLKSDESWCRQACQNIGMVIVDVDYRLAPEFAFPACVWDAWAALKWVIAHASSLGVNPESLSVSGLSAGGHLAAVVALMARDDPDVPPLQLQLLVVPSVDSRYTPAEGPYAEGDPYGSHAECADAPCLPLNRMRWFTRLWIGTDEEERKKNANMWICSPILAESHANLAPASIHCAEIDVLRDEGVAYNKKLNDAGTPSTIKIYKGVCHPFGHWDGELDKAKEYVVDTIAAIKKAHS